MNTTKQSPNIKNEKRWYFLSVFYAREQWAELIIDIMNFYRMHTGLFSAYLFSFSEEYGEHLKVTFASLDIDKDYSTEIQNYFQQLVEQCPSNSAVQFPYGRVLWCNYPNNSISWNKFSLPVYTDQYIAFHQQMIRLAVRLLADDFSEENIFSAGVYLITKALSFIDINEQKNTLSCILGESFLNESDTKYIIAYFLDKKHMMEVFEAIEFCRNENESEYSLDMIRWLNEVENCLKTNKFNILCYFIFKILGIMGVHQILILELLYKYL